ncbi:fatty acyl-CoA hydrolase precursor, medium chain [Lingula anatina]|uniref:Carboxylic ester hydrolase n=1 Tax=Lingula anatina TaxID=7574 RepID=A0A1S3IIS3_LINAN|nr:fatty acyl-CoA hydrolase precursor, medium chain [Lingula anatina]|eukprot:XP_013397404.1 fatty acyl-CoA hydrolase precursor, medium chain [Lingula anatina]
MSAVFFIICAVVGAWVNCQAQISTRNGPIQGHALTIQGKTLNRFLGVPYAKPPLGDLRFKKPQPVENWTGVKNTTVFGDSCMQLVTPEFPLPKKISEDCLTLNLFVPGDIHINNSKAVMVYIHGGGYNTGETDILIFDTFALQGDVIVVTVNYRLGPFGFLTTGDVNAPGNAGLWDQIEGLKWVRDNIENFGGDPNRVTIFGESAGGGSVSQLATTLAARGLFHRFISMSGTAVSDWAFVDGSADIATKMANILGCNSSKSDTAKLVACLRGVDKARLLNASLQVPAYSTGLTFAPVVDGDMFRQPVTESLQNPDSELVRHFRSLDYMGGFLNSDGGGMLLGMAFNYSQGIEPHLLRDELIPNIAKTISTYFESEVAQAIQRVYFSSASEDLGANARGFVNLQTDTAFAVSTVKFLSHHLSSSNGTGSSYLYYFTKEPSFGHLIPMPAWFQGANHADDVAFMLHGQLDLSGLINITLTEAEREFCTNLVNYWTNFAKSGNPNKPVHVPTAWEQYTATGKHYLDLGDTIASKTDVIPQRMKLWLTTIPQILSRGTTPSPTTTSGHIYCSASSVVIITLTLIFLKRLF